MFGRFGSSQLVVRGSLVVWTQMRDVSRVEGGLKQGVGELFTCHDSSELDRTTCE